VIALFFAFVMIDNLIKTFILSVKAHISKPEPLPTFYCLLSKQYKWMKFHEKGIVAKPMRLSWHHGDDPI
jgi:hypothetical protein